MLRAIGFLALSTAAILLTACKDGLRDQFQQACENGGGTYGAANQDCTYPDGAVIRSHD
jgi:hypothetical protein